jgi:hypothetical protein
VLEEVMARDVLVAFEVPARAEEVLELRAVLVAALLDCELVEEPLNVTFEVLAELVEVPEMTVLVLIGEDEDAVLFIVPDARRVLVVGFVIVLLEVEARVLVVRTVEFPSIVLVEGTGPSVFMVELVTVREVGPFC